MTRTKDQERVRTENVILRVLREKHPEVAEFLADQRVPFSFGGATPDVEKLKRLRTAQCKWLDERRKAVNSTTAALLVDKNDEFAEQKRNFLALGDKAVTTEPLRDGKGLITLASNGILTGAELERHNKLQEMERHGFVDADELEDHHSELAKQHKAKADAATDRDKALDAMIARGLAEGWVKPRAPPRKKKG
jgi:hypothetical protein